MYAAASAHKLVLALQMDQFFFMADRHDANFCAVRYITDVRLREWRAYLQPLAARESIVA